MFIPRLRLVRFQDTSLFLLTEVRGEEGEGEEDDCDDGEDENRLVLTLGFASQCYLQGGLFGHSLG